MPQGVSILTSYAGERGRGSTITLPVGTSEAGYGVSRLVDDEPDGLFRSADTDVTIRFDLGAKMPILLVALIHATPQASDSVTIEFSDTPGGGTISIPFGQPGWIGSGQGRYPLNGYLDTTTVEGFDEDGYRYIDFIFSSLAEPLQIGGIKIYSSLTRVPLSRGLKTRPRKADIEHRTSTGVAYLHTHGVTQWAADFEFGGLDPVDLPVLEQHWYEQDGRALPFVFVPNDTLNRCYFCRFSGFDLQTAYETSAQMAIPTGVEELSRGLRPGV